MKQKKHNNSPFSQLKACRKKAGLTQVQLAEMAGVSESRICPYENNVVQPRKGSSHRKMLLAFIEKWKDAEPAELNPGPYAKLKECRKKAMLTQSELGEIIGLSKQTISYLETGKQREVNQEAARKKLLAFIERWRDRGLHSSFLELKSCRKKAGLTQRQLGKIVGVNSDQISMYESGLVEPRIGSPHRKKLLAFIDEQYS